MPLSRPSTQALAAGSAALVALSAAAVGLSSPSSAGGYHQPSGSGPVVSPVRGKPVASAPVPEVTPASAGSPLTAVSGVRSVTQDVVDKAGYQVKEYFISGKARAFRFKDGSTGTLDGRWRTEVDPGSATAYRTRVVVFTPKDPRRFSGNVITEWNNVTAGNDAQPDLAFAHNNLFRHGDAIVGVSAQYNGANAAKVADPQGRGSIDHPGDSWSYDIFSQAGMAVRAKYGQLLGGLKPRTVLGDGESQSAGRLEVYINAVTPIDHVFDGYLVHSRGNTTFPLQEAETGPPQTGPTPPAPGSGKENVGRRDILIQDYVRSRTDLVEPVIYLQSESDVYSPPDGALDYGPATQANSRGFRLWEVAGAAHIDDYVINTGPRDTGTVEEATQQLAAQLNPPSTLGGFVTCDAPINTGTHNVVTSAALVALTRWAATGGVDGGIAAPAPPLFAGQGPNQQPGRVPPPQRDADGIIIGGIRTPSVDVPISTLTGRFTSCALSGTTTPFSAQKLRERYPTKRDFVEKYRRSVATQVRGGYITPYDGFLLVRAAERITFPTS